MLLFVALVCVPPLALVVLVQNPGVNSFRDAAWVFAAYFAIAWLLLIGVIVRPAHVTRPLLALVVLIALVTEVPMALAMETALHNSTANLAGSILTVGLPEELAKAVPVVAVALLMRRRPLTPVDYLFLGAASGLAFGASEAVRYFTFGPPAGANEAATVLTYVWRFVADPVGHACWAGLTGYFIGLALTGRSWVRVGWLGLAMAAVLHGLNDWPPVNSHPAWVAVVLVSALLFVGYAKAGPAAVAAPVSATGSAPAQSVSQAPAPGHPWHAQQAAATTQPVPPGAPPSRPAAGQPGAANAGQPWWQVTGAASAAPAPQQPSPELKRPWWEQ